MTQTEAEKRGAKFGTMGVVKETGEKFVYLGDGLAAKDCWVICVEGSENIWSIPCDGVRLDHEPKFKEIRFCDATHEQRMVAENLKNEWGTGVSDVCYSEKNSIYVVFTKVGTTDFLTSSSGHFTVRVPA